jgi:peroxiredoxin
MSTRRSRIGVLITTTGAALAYAGAVGAAFPLAFPASGCGEFTLQPEDARTLIRPGTAAPDFTLKDTDDKAVQLSTIVKEGKIVVLEWIDPRCPQVAKHYEKAGSLKDLREEFKDQGVAWIAVNSKKENEGGGWLESMRAKDKWQLKHAVVVDADGKTAEKHGVMKSPTVVIVNLDGKVVYAGAVDDDDSESTIGKTNYVREALRHALAGETIEKDYTTPYGCSIHEQPKEDPGPGGR